MSVCVISVCVLPCGIDIMMYLTCLALGIWPWLMVFRERTLDRTKKSLQLVLPCSAGADPNFIDMQTLILDLKSDQRSHKTKEEM